LLFPIYFPQLQPDFNITCSWISPLPPQQSCFLPLFCDNCTL
jgi:hypothetical protein